MMSITRFLAAKNLSQPCTFLYGARTSADMIFQEECERFANKPEWFSYQVALSQAPDTWTGFTGRLNGDHLAECVAEVSQSRYFLCGPNAFMEDFQSLLTDAGVPKDRIHTEQFHAVATNPQSV